MGPKNDATQIFQILFNLYSSHVFLILKELLSDQCLSMKELVAVTLLVNDMKDFSDINQEYITYFGKNPPIRVCVEAPIGNNKIALSAIGFHDLEKKISTMHVQSISHWAPANIGPYSQANMVDGILHIAGQIGLIPGSVFSRI